nr:Hypothetical protein CBG13393 [Haemonchus contortus]
MNDGGAARVLAVYGGTTFLVYLETNGFTQQTQSMMLGLPLMALSFLSLTSSMQPRARLGTAASFATLAISRYLIVSKSSYEGMEIGYILVTLGNLMYLYSFHHLIEEWSIALSMFVTMFYCTFTYICFADLSASIPFLVFLHSLSFGSACLLVVAAGSVCMNPTETDSDTYQASIIRFVGTLGNMAHVCNLIRGFTCDCDAVWICSPPQKKSLSSNRKHRRLQPED